MLSPTSILITASLGLAVAQTTTSTFSTASVTQNSSSSSFPTVSVFLPLDIPAQLNASVISASPNQTTYAFLSDSSTLTLTEGQSTLLFTSPGSSGDGVTVNCALSGATSAANVSATAAVCTGTSAIGKVTVASTTTLAAGQISYFPVTVTAGEDALFAVITQATPPVSLSSTKSPNAAGHTGVPVVVAAAAGMIGLGLL